MLAQIARRVQDLPRARAFFAAPGEAELYTFPGMAFFALGPTRLMLRETGTQDPAEILYLSVPGIAAAFAGLAAKGIAATQAPHKIHTHPDGTEEWMAFFKDDEGRDLAFHALQRP